MTGMLRGFRYFVLLLVLHSTLAAWSASAPSQDSLALRGVFADAFGTQFRDHLSTTRLAQQLSDYEVQNCFLQVCVLGEGYYKSDILPRAAGMPIGYNDPLGDLLNELKAKNAKVRVHAWISPLQAHNARAIVRPQENHVVVKHPEWLTKDIEGNQADANGWVYLDPGHPEVQDYVVSIVKELAGSQPIAGILIDGLQYPEQGARFGYNEKALERFRAETGAKGTPDPMDPAWMEWRRTQLTKLLTRIFREVKESNPDMIVSATAKAGGPAPRTEEGFKFSTPYVAYLQDWLSWAEFDMADWIILQNFCDEQIESNQFDDWTRFAVANRADTKLWIAVAGYQNWAIDAFFQIQRALINDADAVAVYNFRQPVRDIATTSDFFAAVQSVTLLPQREIAAVAGAPSASLQERMARMQQALEQSQIALAEKELAPGVSTSLPMQAEKRPTHVPEEKEGRLPFLAPWDQIYLTNQSMFEGHKIGEMNGESIFETASGLIIKINNQYIDRIRPGR